MMKIKTKEIHILQCFADNPPSAAKMKRKAQHFYKTGNLQSEIVLNESGSLIDGYTSYLLAVQHGLSYVPVRYGKRQVITARHKQGGPLYVWEVPRRLIDTITPGDRVIVPTNNGKRTVRVAAVKDWEPEQCKKTLKQIIGKRSARAVEDWKTAV